MAKFLPKNGIIAQCQGLEQAVLLAV